MYIYPNIYKQFECIGSACKKTCCAGWKINFDSETMEYYRNLNTDFGKKIQENIYEENGMTLLRMTSDKRCPFLDKDGLCQIYQECGPEHMGKTCRDFPRRRFTKGGNDMSALSLSCEAVLQILQDYSDPIRICVEGNTDMNTMDDISVYEIAQFIAWGVEVLQDSSVPFGIAMGTVIYIGMEVGPCFMTQDYKGFESVLLQADAVQSEFQQVQESIGKDELVDSAWQFILQVTDSFFAALGQMHTSYSEALLWPEETTDLSDLERKEYIRKSYMEYRTRRNEEQHLLFMRRMASLLFCGYVLGIEVEENEKIFLQNICNFILLAEIVPAICSAGKTMDPDKFYPGLVDLSRLFQQTDFISKYTWPVIKELFAPDALTYTLAFMALFDEL